MNQPIDVMSRRIAILGSTGSIGRQALEWLSGESGMSICALGAGNSAELLARQVREHRPQAVGLASEQAAEALREQLPDGVELFSGPGAMCQLIRHTRPDVVLQAVVGAAGLQSTLTAVECGSTLALANKESLVCAGAVVMPAARRAGVAVLPVDSEHAGIFQCLQGAEKKDVRRVIITSSGGALRNLADEQAEKATVEEALNHPTWTMGKKITIDSATLMNKALEIIEAHWLFDLPAERIEVVLHPQSVIHAMVEFRDGSMLAHLASPDMKGPIAYALSYPDRPGRETTAPMDLPALGRLEFQPLTGRFGRAVNLGYEAIRRGGPAGAVLNAANEAAVEAFLQGKIRFGEILTLIETVFRQAEGRESFPDTASQPNEESDTLSTLLSADAWARKKIKQLLTK
ncbi:MAG: 1-deoxy-D-xylulose-5-phosphate reductoisomerase [Phycisphaerae bacterium]|nr:1-deoxy-D-xylulose-5-phosphate reductoisomerase [Phycisphaerae bacterium]